MKKRMKLHYPLFFLFSIGLGTIAWSQDYSVYFPNGKQQFEANIEDFSSESISSEEIWQSHFYRFIQFKSIPTDAEKNSIEQMGIELLDYIPNNTYIASLPTPITATQLEELNVRSIMKIDATYKVGQHIQDEDYPEWAVTKFKTVLLSISFYDNVDFNRSLTVLEAMGVQTYEKLANANMCFVEVNPEGVGKLIAQPFVKYVDIIPEPGTPESDDGRNLYNANEFSRLFHIFTQLRLFLGKIFYVC